MAQAPTFMVFFDWDSSRLSPASLNVITQAVTAFRSTGNARVTATGHTDTSGSDSYNMALSLRRANAVKNELVRQGVPADAIASSDPDAKGAFFESPQGKDYRHATYYTKSEGVKHL